MLDFEKKIAHIQQLISRGKLGLARREIKKLTRKKIPRHLILEVATLSRRSHLPFYSIRLLNPYVRLLHPGVSLASAPEKAEYAVSLSQIGAVEEAIELLKGIDTQKYPDVLLFKSFALIERWNYKDSIELLKEYTKRSDISEYQKLVGEVNLAAAFVHEGAYHDSKQLLLRLMHETERNDYRLLHGNVLELLAQNSIQNEEWNEAEEFLKKASHALSGSESVYDLLVRKWKAILDLLKTKGSLASISRLKVIRDEALYKEQWEIVRDCDSYLAIMSLDKELFLKVYFGTPNALFRKGLFDKMKGTEPPPEQYEWRVPHHPQKSREDTTTEMANKLDLSTGKTDREGVLELGRLLHRLIIALASDFYRPIRIASLHSEIYRGEYFNPDSSPQRVHQAIKRFKKWCVQCNVPLKIVEKRGTYSLFSTAPFSISIHLGFDVSSKQELLIQRFKNKWGSERFSSRDVCGLLDISPTSSRRLLSSLRKQGMIESVGSGVKTTYVIRPEKALIEDHNDL